MIAVCKGMLHLPCSRSLSLTPLPASNPKTFIWSCCTVNNVQTLTKWSSHLSHNCSYGLDKAANMSVKSQKSATNHFRQMEAKYETLALKRTNENCHFWWMWLDSTWRPVGGAIDCSYTKLPAVIQCLTFIEFFMLWNLTQKQHQLLRYFQKLDDWATSLRSF